jgi:hypothetical protein
MTIKKALGLVAGLVEGAPPTAETAETTLWPSATM